MTKNGRRLAAGLAAAGILGTLGLSWKTAHAATATGNVSVSANVAANCTVSGGTVAFGSYDPVAANASADLDQNGAVTVACTKGTSATVTLGLGANASGSTRRMLANASDYLTYELYTTAGRTTVWNSSNSVAYVAANKAPTPLTIYGRVPGGQDAATGSYADTVVATITF